jgi:hypothetical protein
MIDLLQWPAMALGLLGAFLVASGDRGRRRVGFGVWVASNGLWIAWGCHGGAWGLVAMQVAFTATSVLGWWSHRPSAGRP